MEHVDDGLENRKSLEFYKANVVAYAFNVGIS